MAKGTNSLALVSLISGILGWVALPVVASLIAIITGHLARAELRRTGEDGDGLALAGLVLGYSNFLIGCIAIGFVILLYVGLLGAVMTLGAT